MIDGIPISNDVSTGALLVVIFFLVLFGKIATPREVKDYKETITWLRQRNEELIAQNTLLVREIGGATMEFMNDIRKAGSDE